MLVLAVVSSRVQVGVTVPGTAGYGADQQGRWVPEIARTDSLVHALGLQNLSIPGLDCSSLNRTLLLGKRNIKACYFGRCCKLYLFLIDESLGKNSKASLWF